MIIAIDFDGTCTVHSFPHTGRDIGAQKVLKQLTDKGHQLILYTMRCNHDGETPTSTDTDIVCQSGNYLDDAIYWFEKNNIPLYAVGYNPDQSTWTTSNKCYAHLYIDDAALGIPLIYEQNERPYIDWDSVEVLLKERGII